MSKICLPTTSMKGVQMNHITELLDLEDSDIFVSDIQVNDKQNTLILEGTVIPDSDSYDE